MRVKENLHPLLDARGNLVTKDEARLRYLMPSLSQSLTVREVVLQTHSPLSRKTGMGSRRKFPKSTGKWSAICYVI